jgi:hypothetical protein
LIQCTYYFQYQKQVGNIMNFIKIFFLNLIVVLTLASCDSLHKNSISQTGLAQEIATCVGEIAPPLPGLEAVSDPALLAQAVAEDGKGGLCIGQVYQVTQPVTVFRVWNKDKAYTKYGRWWSFNEPTGSREEYRKANDICPSWSELNQVSHCKLKVGSHIVVGPGQSAQCKAMKLPKSPVNQVFVPNDSRNNQLFVEECTEGESWPYSE